jgi:LysR family transcriptional regulator, cell division regulator
MRNDCFKCVPSVTVMAMEFSDLNLFATVARHGNITKAAQRLNTVQSNVTTRLRLLEEELGVPLFQRHHQGVTLTRAGHDLLPFAQQAEALLQKARDTVSHNGQPHGALRLGSMETTAAARLPALLKAYAPSHRNVDIAVETGTTRNLIQAVLEYRLDGAFVAGPVEHDDLDAIPSFVEELVLVSTSRHRSLETALREGGIHKLFVFRVGCSYRQRLERFLGARGITLINQLEFGTLEGILGCVSAGLGVTMLPLSVVDPYARRKEVAVHRISPEDARSETVFITRRDTLRSLALEEFLRTLSGTVRMTTQKKRMNGSIRRERKDVRAQGPS